MNRDWFDTHVHLSDPKFDNDREEIVKKVFQSGVAGFIEIADGPSEWPKALALAQHHPGKIWWAAGLHPYFADQATPDLWNSLKELSKTSYFVALGEVGLDYAKCPIPKEKQIETFQQALDLSQDIEKPLVIHCREAYMDLHPILKSRYASNNSISPGVIHCFSGTEKDAEILLELGFYLGVDGPLTYPKSDPLRKIFSTIPLERIVIETDSPYLPPQNIRGQRNDPSYLPVIGTKLAELRGLSPERTADQLWHNFHTLFRLKRIEN